MTATTELLDLVRRWAAAEQDNDPGRLDEVLDGDFRGVGTAAVVVGALAQETSFQIGALQAAGPRSA